MSEEKATPTAEEIEEQVKALLDNDVRPAVQMDGGDVEFVEMLDGVVYVRLKGACVGCPSSTMTLKMGIERYLCEKVPGVKSVESA